MTGPNRLTPAILSEADHLRVSGAVSAAEAHTNGEIVTILTEESDDYHDVALAWAIVAAFIALTVVSLAPQFYLGLVERLIGAWGIVWTPQALLTLAAVVAMLKFAGVWLLLLIPRLRMLLVPPPIRTSRVHARAVAAFRMAAERRTHARTGILIYLSMREHRAEILADEKIAAQVPPEVWAEALAAMLAELKQGRIAEGIVAAVDRVGTVLAEHLPREDDDRNELPDRLIEL